MNYYFAYGSNMSFSRIQKRCPQVQDHSIACLKNWELIFNKEKTDLTGAANVRPKTGAHVWGVLYLLTNEDLLTLDTFEGYNHLATENSDYIRQSIEVELLNKSKITASIYIADPNAPSISPSIEYLNYLLVGASEHQLPVDYQNFLKNTLL